MNEKYEMIFKKFNGIFKTKDVCPKYISRTILRKILDEGIIKKISRGIYYSKEFLYDEMYIYQLRYSKIVYSYNSALYIHKMTERVPHVYDVTVYSKYDHLDKNDLFSVTKVSKKLYKLGLTTKKTSCGNDVWVYNLERTICDMVKNKKEMEQEIFTKVIENYFSSKDKNIKQLLEYAKIMNIYDKIIAYMEMSV